MITTGAKFWYALAALGVVGGLVYWFTSGGEWYGGIALLFLAIAAGVLGTMSVVVRDGDVEVPAEGQTVEERPRPYSLPAVWPVAAGLGIAVSAIGLAARNVLVWVGVAILVATFVEWMVQAWAERSTPDPRANLGLRNRIMFPVEIPALAVIGVGLVVIAISRVLLAVPATASAVIAIVVASVILLIAAVLANRPGLGSSVLSGVVAVGAVVLVAGGIVGAVAGEREFEHHGEEAHAEEAEDETIGEQEEGVDAVEDAPANEPEDDEVPEELQIEGDEVEGETPGEEPESIRDPVRSDPDTTTPISTP